MSQEKIAILSEELESNLQIDMKNTVYSSGASATFNVSIYDRETIIEFTNDFISNTIRKDIILKLKDLNFYKNVLNHLGETIIINHRSIIYRRA